MTTWTRADLPILGVRWTRFATLRQARKFAAWCERETRGDSHPCEAVVTMCDDMPAGEQYEVKVRNW